MQTALDKAWKNPKNQQFEPLDPTLSKFTLLNMAVNMKTFHRKKSNFNGIADARESHVVHESLSQQQRYAHSKGRSHVSGDQFRQSTRKPVDFYKDYSFKVTQ